MKHKALITLGCFVAAVILLAVIQLLTIKYSGSSVEAPSIPRSVQEFGSTGSPLKYAVMGDSTSIGQGADYSQSYAYNTAEHLAKNHKVKLLNVGVSERSLKIC